MLKLHESINSVSYEWVVIKDIDCRHKFGNLMNRLYDFVINHEKIHDMSPAEWEESLEKIGYHVDYHYISKLWYPHLLIIGKRREM